MDTKKTPTELLKEFASDFANYQMKEKALISLNSKELYIPG